MMRDSRWLALAMLVGGLALVTYGWSAPWIAVSGADDRGALASTTYLTHWTWFASSILGAGIAFEMVIGIRRRYLPPHLIVWSLAAIAIAGLAIVIHGTVAVLELDTVEAVDPQTFQETQVACRVSIAPWLAVAGFVCVAASAVWLSRLRARA